MARVNVGPARAPAAPAHRSGIGGWVVGAVIAILIALVVAYFVFAGGGTRYNAPTYTSAPATAAPAATAPGAPAATAPAVPVPQMTSAPAPYHYP